MLRWKDSRRVFRETPTAEQISGSDSRDPRGKVPSTMVSRTRVGNPFRGTGRSLCGRFGSWEFREASEDYYREMDAMKQDLIQWYRSGNYDKPCLVVWVGDPASDCTRRRYGLV